MNATCISAKSQHPPRGLSEPTLDCAARVRAGEGESLEQPLRPLGARRSSDPPRDRLPPFMGHGTPTPSLPLPPSLWKLSRVQSGEMRMDFPGSRTRGEGSLSLVHPLGLADLTSTSWPAHQTSGAPPSSSVHRPALCLVVASLVPATEAYCDGNPEASCEP